MSERLPLPRLEGSLSITVGIDYPFSFPSSYDGSVERIELTLFEPSTTDPVVAQLRTIADELLVEVTIPVGDRSASAVPSDVTIAAGTGLILRVVEGADAEGLGGWFDVVIVPFSTPAEGDLTSVAAVKQYQRITTSEQDALIQSLVTEVSLKMQRWIGREIALAETELEAHDGTGASDVITLRKYPVTTVSEVTLDAETLDEETYELDAESGLLYYQPDGRSVPWPKGRRNIRVSYESGYDQVPADLHGAARVQVVWELKRTASHGGRLGERSTVFGDGGTAQYLVDDWAPGVLEVLERYKPARLAVV